MGGWHFLVADVEIELGHYDAAIDECHKAIEAGYRNYYVYVDLAAAYALQGQDGRGEVPIGGSPPPQSQSHGQMENRAFAELAEAVRRPAQGGAAGGMSDIRAGDIGWTNGCHPPK
jgi:hypothetical protein